MNAFCFSHPEEPLTILEQEEIYCSKVQAWLKVQQTGFMKEFSGRHASLVSLDFALQYLLPTETEDLSVPEPCDMFYWKLDRHGIRTL